MSQPYPPRPPHWQGPVYPPYPPVVRESVTSERKRTRHGLHLVLSILTFGVWAFTGWPIAWAINTWGPRARTVTRNHY